MGASSRVHASKTISSLFVFRSVKYCLVLKGYALVSSRVNACVQETVALLCNDA